MSMARPMIRGAHAPAAAPVARQRARVHLSAMLSPRRTRRPKMFYAAVSVGVILLVIIAQILLSIALQSGAYEISGLKQQVRDIDRAHQSASTDIDRLGSPQNLSRSAEELGMVSNSSPAYLRLSTGATTGWVSQASSGASMYRSGDMVPNAQMDSVFAERDAARAAEAARQASAAKAASSASGSASSNLGTGATSGAPTTVSGTAPVASTPGIPAPATH